MEIRADNLESEAVIDLLREHLGSMEDTAPPESRHALDIDALRSSNINFWSIWDGERLAGFAALLHHNDDLAESLRRILVAAQKINPEEKAGYIINDKEGIRYLEIDYNKGVDK